MNGLLYWTVWLALAAYTAGEFAKARRWPGAWSTSASGAILLTIHILLAMALRHGWSHTAALEATARQTNDVFGVDWGGGVYVNYLFAAVWIAELFVWRQWPEGYASRPSWMRWPLRAFYFVIIASGAVTFAVGWRRILGLALIATLVLSWARDFTSVPPSLRR